MFTLRRVVGVNGDSHIDCIVLTLVASSPLDNHLPGNYLAHCSGFLYLIIDVIYTI